MSGKRVSIGARPSQPAMDADAWVQERVAPETPEKVQRLTVDVPASLHRKIKAAGALEGRTISEIVRDLLIQKYGNH